VTVAETPSRDDATSAEVAISIRDVDKVYGQAESAVLALDAIDLDIRRGEFVTLIGPSGCGKTTLLRIIAGLEAPSVGTVGFGPRATDGPLRSMVFQEHGVLPWMTVLDNVAYGLRVRGVPKAQRLEVARSYIRMLGLTRFENAYPRQLSGGMRQRVSVARAFANDPEILLMDEPFGALDEQTRMMVHADLLRLWQEHRKTVVFVTHSLSEAVLLSDRIVVMSSRPGRIKESISVPLERPRHISEAQSSPEFAAVRGRLWDALRDEIELLNAQEASAPPIPRRSVWRRLIR